MGVQDFIDYLQKDNDRLKKVLDQMIDDEPCQYDHHDLCQAHHLHERPCPHEVAKEIVK